MGHHRIIYYNIKTTEKQDKALQKFAGSATCFIRRCYYGISCRLRAYKQAALCSHTRPPKYKDYLFTIRQ